MTKRMELLALFMITIFLVHANATLVGEEPTTTKTISGANPFEPIVTLETHNFTIETIPAVGNSFDYDPATGVYILKPPFKLHYGVMGVYGANTTAVWVSNIIDHRYVVYETINNSLVVLDVMGNSKLLTIDKVISWRLQGDTIYYLTRSNDNMDMLYQYRIGGSPVKLIKAKDINHFAPSQDNTLIIVNSTLYSLPDMKPIRVVEGVKGTGKIVWSYDNRHIIALNKYRDVIRIIDTETGNYTEYNMEIPTFGFGVFVFPEPNYAVLYTRSESDKVPYNLTLTCFDLDTGQIVWNHSFFDVLGQQIYDQNLLVLTKHGYYVIDRYTGKIMSTEVPLPADIGDYVIKVIEHNGDIVGLSLVGTSVFVTNMLKWDGNWYILTSDLRVYPLDGYWIIDTGRTTYLVDADGRMLDAKATYLNNLNPFYSRYVNWSTFLAVGDNKTLILAVDNRGRLETLPFNLSTPDLKVETVKLAGSRLIMVKRANMEGTSGFRIEIENMSVGKRIEDYFQPNLTRFRELILSPDASNFVVQAKNGLLVGSTDGSYKYTYWFNDIRQVAWIDDNELLVLRDNSTSPALLVKLPDGALVNLPAPDGANNWDNAVASYSRDGIVFVASGNLANTALLTAYRYENGEFKELCRYNISQIIMYGYPRNGSVGIPKYIGDPFIDLKASMDHKLVALVSNKHLFIFHYNYTGESCSINYSAGYNIESAYVREARRIVDIEDHWIVLKDMGAKIIYDDKGGVPVRLPDKPYLRDANIILMTGYEHGINSYAVVRVQERNGTIKVLSWLKRQPILQITLENGTTYQSTELPPLGVTEIEPGTYNITVLYWGRYNLRTLLNLTITVNPGETVVLDLLHRQAGRSANRINETMTTTQSNQIATSSQTQKSTNTGHQSTQKPLSSTSATTPVLSEATTTGGKHSGKTILATGITVLLIIGIAFIILKQR